VANIGIDYRGQCAGMKINPAFFRVWLNACPERSAGNVAFVRSPDTMGFSPW